MNRTRNSWAAVGLLAGLTWAGAASAQWEPTARLGLSAAPDQYVETIAPTIGEPFTLHVILTGMNEDEPLAFNLQSVTWLIHTVCCGDSPVGVTDLVYGDGITAVGDPYEEVTTSVPDCPGGETLLLATAQFEWLLEGETSFLLSAGALTAGLACDDSAHLLQTLVVDVVGQDPSPVEADTWSGIKALYVGEGGTP